jgi:asparagine synthase (glutamine-hydrolysing)
VYSRGLGGTPEALRERQPIVTPAVVLVYEGRVDNRTEVAAKCRRAELATAPDGDVLLAAFTAWGEAFPRHVDGEYAFVLFERRERRLVAGRDAVGVKKLYLADDGRRFCLASSLALLLRYLRKPPPLDSEGLVNFIASGGLVGASGRTVYRGIRPVPPGHVLACSEGAFHVRPYWTLEEGAEVAPRSVDECDSHFRAVLFDSVKGALRALSPVGTELSGGLDSSTVTSVAATVTSRQNPPATQLIAFSLVASETWQADERRYQDAVLERYPLEHQTYDLDQLPDDLSFGDAAQPAFLNAQPWLLSAQRAFARERGVRVSLTGQGGDAVMGYYLPPFHLSPMLRSLRLRAWFRESVKWVGHGSYSWWRLLSVFGSGDTRRGMGPLPRLPQWLVPRMARQVRDALDALVTAPSGRFLKDPRTFHVHLVRNMAASLPDADYFPWEPRYPLLSRALVEFMLTLPWQAKASPVENRVVQRRALKDVLPQQVAQRRSKGDFTPRFFRGLQRNWGVWEPLTRGKHLADLGIVEPGAFQDAAERLRFGVADSAFSLLCACLILEGWLDARARAAPLG